MFSLITADQFVLKGIVHSKLSFQNCKTDFLLGKEQTKQKQKILTVLLKNVDL